MTKFFQLRDSSESQKTPCISIRGEIMIVNGEPVCYGKQMLTNQNFFLTDHGIDLPFDSGIDEFDRKYFDYLLISKVISEIECSHPKVAIQILQQLPQLSEKSYINIILKLSLTKLRHLLMDHNFYLFLWEKIMTLAFSPLIQTQKAIIEVECGLNELDQPQKRVLYMIEHLKGNQPFLSALRMTGTELIQEYISSNRFLNDLLQKKRVNLNESEDKEYGSQRGGCYLQNIRDAYYSLIMLPTANNQTYQVLKLKGKRTFFRLFRKQCLKVITLKFDFYFNYHRRNLIEVLAIIAVENGHQLWPEIIYKKYIPEQSIVGNSCNASVLDEQNSSRSRRDKSAAVEETDNSSTFVLLIVNNFLEPGQAQWQQSLIILEAVVRFNATQAHHCLIRIFIQTAKHSLCGAILDLSLTFIGDLYGKEGTDRKIELFLLELLSIVNCNISEDHLEFKDKSPFKAKYKVSSLQNNRFISYLRLYGVILEIKAIETLLMLDCGSILEALLVMTQTAQGIAGALRSNLIKKIQAYIVEAELQQQQYLRLAKAVEKVPFREARSSEPINKKLVQFITFMKSLITK